MIYKIRLARLLTALLFPVLLAPTLARAHCDTLEGPVLVEARAALVAGDVTPVLKWVRAADEATIRDAFARTLAVRQASKPAAELAELWFFETLVRIHRAGEGAPYTGLKSGVVEEPGVAAADQALASGDAGTLWLETTDRLRGQLEEKLRRVRDLKEHAAHSVDAGRAYVAAYVDYVHFAERLASLAAHAPAHAAAGGHSH